MFKTTKISSVDVDKILEPFKLKILPAGIVKMAAWMILYLD